MTIFIAAICLLFPMSVKADFAAALKSKAPLTFAAERGLEWDRNARTYNALGGVQLNKGNLNVRMNKLYATHRKNGDILKIVASGNVSAVAGKDSLKAGVVTYSPDAQEVLLSKNIEIKVPGQSLKSNGSIVYNQGKNLIIAKGRPTVSKGTTQLTADTIEVKLTQTSNTTNVSQAIANGNVVITTPNERVTGNKAVYTDSTQIARMSGNVVITRAGNKIQGTQATVNLASGVSTLTNESGSGRVTGVLQLP